MNLYKANFDNEESMSKVNPVGTGSFSMNRKTETIVGSNSATVGFDNTAQGDNSFAEGCYTKALSESQHVQGKYNVEDTENKYAHIVGNGTSEDTRSNAHTLDWDGNAWYAGDVTATDEDGNSVSLVGMRSDILVAVNEASMSKVASGISITVDNSANLPFVGMNIYGKSVQDDVPTASAPIDIVSVENPQIQVTGDDGENPQTMGLTRTLFGVPTDWGGNYTDANGQLWLCDEIDFARGIYIQRVYELTLDGTQTVNDDVSYDEAADVDTTGASITLPYAASGYGLCTFATSSEAPIAANTFKLSGNTFRFRMSINDISDAALAATWFAENPQTLIFALETPVETVLTDAELTAYKALVTYNPITNINNNANAYMSIDYITQNYEKAVKLMMAGDYLSPGDVVNNLTSTATDLPLSASMGKQLATNITNAKADLVDHVFVFYDKVNISAGGTGVIYFPRGVSKPITHIKVTMEIAYSQTNSTLGTVGTHWEVRDFTIDTNYWGESEKNPTTGSTTIGGKRVEYSAEWSAYYFKLSNVKYNGSSVASVIRCYYTLERPNWSF